MMRKIIIPLPGGGFKEAWKDCGKGGGTPRSHGMTVWGIGGGKKAPRMKGGS